ncbi:hypothetical protein E3N88_05918 [Mikania micrantha]|uniref:Uncharacterized protein n=1 Tax=Mikania micrantha TaxID=192012 RepID=A0A5N6PN67_9ASTR|nr:hypothetical protein E3N88_05918 [Mikania micrantha]
MASVDPSLISDPNVHKWAVEIDEKLNHQLEIDIETPPVSLFQVPETITSKKPEAYEPQQIGLGPVHHFRPRPYKKMEQKKLGVLRKVLKDYEIKDYKLHVLKKVAKLVPIARSCYDMFLQDDDESLARIFAIDGLFLHNLLHTYNSPIEEDTQEYLLFLENKAQEFSMFVEDQIVNVDPLEIVVTADNQIQWENILHLHHHQPKLPEIGLQKRSMAQDILMVENQIPFMVLKEINDTLHSSSGSSSHLILNFSPFVYRVFCEVHSPLKLCSKSQAPSSVDHLLHYMYYSILNNVPVEQPSDTFTLSADAIEEVKESEIEEVYNFFSKIPQKEIVQAYEQTVSMLETFTQTKTLIPAASKLHGEAGFQFHSLEKDQGIPNIHIKGNNIYLPSIDLKNDSEVILRNLVAYETLTVSSDSSFPLNEYMGLMCGLIVNNDDVKYLKNQNIVTGDLSEDEVVKIFTGMSGSIAAAKTKRKSKLQEMIDETNKVYESGLRMKAYLLLKQLARFLLVVLRAIGSFVKSTWKIVAFMMSIVAVFLLTLQAYCDVFGCGKNTVTLTPYASG